MKNLSNIPENFVYWEDSVNRVGGDEEFLVELLTDLKGMVNDNIEKIKKSLENIDFKEIRELAHSMKGASGNLGLNTMYEVTSNMEQSAKDQDAINIKKHLENLEEDYKNLIVLLSK